MNNIKNWLSFNEGTLYKSSKPSYSDKSSYSDRITSFQGKIESLVYGQGAVVKQIGTDFEIVLAGEVIAQVMFRDNFIAIKKTGSKFPNEYKYDEFGKIKSDITDIIKKEKYK